MQVMASFSEVFKWPILWERLAAVIKIISTCISLMILSICVTFDIHLHFLLAHKVVSCFYKVRFTAYLFILFPLLTCLAIIYGYWHFDQC